GRVLQRPRLGNLIPPLASIKQQLGQRRARVEVVDADSPLVSELLDEAHRSVGILNWNRDVGPLGTLDPPSRIRGQRQLWVDAGNRRSLVFAGDQVLQFLQPFRGVLPAELADLLEGDRDCAHQGCQEQAAHPALPAINPGTPTRKTPTYAAYSPSPSSTARPRFMPEAAENPNPSRTALQMLNRSTAESSP